MSTATDLRSYFCSIIGKGKRFSSNAQMARFLGLGSTTATKLYSFLKGADTQYSTVVLPGEGLDSYVMVPGARTGADAGESLAREGGSGLYAFRLDVLEREHIPPEKCVLMPVSDDSMEPLIREGDTILVDESAREPKDGRIFVVGLGDVLLVKRLAKIPDGWRLCSENRNRPDTDVRGGELESLRFHGRVRWFGRMLR